MHHFLYCFDKNYIKQGSVSIYSLLENIDQKVNIHVISDLNQKSINLPKKISNHRNLEKIFYYQIKMPELSLYNLKGAHVTEATFYRIFLEKHLSFDDYVTYLDCDVICIKNPLPSIDKVIGELKLSNYFISFNTEIKDGDGYSYFKDLEMKGKRYFNAGVMIFNLKEWNNFNIIEKSLKLIPKIKDKALFWDQDILNVIIDDFFLELPDSLNSRNRENNFLNTELHHFSGKYKPWSINGAKQKYAQLFHDYYYDIFGKRYLIVVPNIKNGFKHLSVFISKLDKKTNKKDLTLIYYTIAGLIKRSFK